MDNSEFLDVSKMQFSPEQVENIDETLSLIIYRGLVEYRKLARTDLAFPIGFIDPQSSDNTELGRLRFLDAIDLMIYAFNPYNVDDVSPETCDYDCVEIKRMYGRLLFAKHFHTLYI